MSRSSNTWFSLGAKTKKMNLGHRGANHPVKNLSKGQVEITSQNHGFEIIQKKFTKENQSHSQVII